MKTHQTKSAVRFICFEYTYTSSLVSQTLTLRERVWSNPHQYATVATCTAFCLYKLRRCYISGQKAIHVAPSLAGQTISTDSVARETTSRFDQTLSRSVRVWLDYYTSTIAKYIALTSTSMGQNEVVSRSCCRLCLVCI